MATEAQSAAFTADLRKAEKHPALMPRPKDRPIWMWISSGTAGQALEILLCPPDNEDAKALTGFPRATALLHRGERKNGAWVQPPEFIGYLSAQDAQFIAKVLLGWDGDPLPGEWRGGASVETLNV